MATIKGDRRELKPNFFAISRASENGKLIAFYNGTTDTQFNVCYTFTEATMKPLGKTRVDGQKYATTVYPEETIELAEGKWKSYKISLSFGAPDQEWQAAQAKKVDGIIDEEIAALKALVKQHPRADGKYTSEYIAELCIQHNVKFVDLTFPPKPQSFRRDWEPVTTDYDDMLRWARPDQFCSKDQPPQLYVGDIEPNDIDQGVLGDCYFLCGVACIAEFPLLVRDAFSLQQHPELGIYRVLVCKNGWWQTVIVDDFLPVIRGRPCFARNREEPNELWVSLLEKAYAKLHGSYCAIKSGDTALAIGDILGAPYRKLRQMQVWGDKAQLFKMLKDADEADDLMSIGTPGGIGSDPPLIGERREAAAKQYESAGLAIDHCYSLLRVKEAQGNKLCMIRNPWGDEKEWNGAWSDNSTMWTESLQKEVGFYKGDDGTFWMAWEDVIKWFDNGSLSNVLREWVQLRVTANFDGPCADLIMTLEVTKPVECYIGAHQRDNRGLPTGDKDRTYCGLLVSLLQQNEEGTGCVKLGESNGGKYANNRDALIECVRLEPSTRPYVILIQPFEDIKKSFVYSLIMSDPTAFSKISFATHGGDKKKYLPATKFSLSDWPQKAVANYQLRMAKKDGEGMLVHQAQGDSVDMKALGGSIPVAKKPVNLLTPGQKPQPQHVDPTSGAAKPAHKAGPPQPATKPPASAVAKVGNQSGIKLQLLVLSGRNLVSKDSNGLSDPYVTVKLKNQQGANLPNDQRQETRYIAETLNPVWCEVMKFNCGVGDVLCIKCWDKDTFGHDAMGVINLPVAEAIKGLKAGGPAKIEWMKLVPPPADATGELQLAFSWLL